MTALASAPPTVVKIVIAAILYVLCGRLGLFLAVPPGYATVIWPASGIAIGSLLAHGPSLWPGVFIGSFALNAAIGPAYTAEAGWDLAKLTVAAVIAAGSTAQALTARWLIGRFLGTPVNLRGGFDVLKLVLIAAPISCLTASTVGVASLYLAGTVTLGDVGRNWSTWWCGDMLGIVVFLPLVLIAPGAEHALTWRGARLGTLPIAAILVLLLPLGLTFYAWKASSEYIHERGRAAFVAAVASNEQALLHRLATYDQGLLGAAGFIKGSDTVTAAEWRTFVEAIEPTKNFPGINGIGFIRKVEPDDLPGFVAANRKERPGFAIYPEALGRPNFIIEHLEPLVANAAALGLNIAFEENRFQAAARARDSGEPAITKRITLVQDRTGNGGFLLLHPLYRSGAPTDTVGYRRAALVGWVYAPFVISNFMSGLSEGRGEALGLRIFEGDERGDEALIYDDGAAGAAGTSSAFTLRKSVGVMQQTWTLDWASTPAFERGVRSGEPALILGGGLIFTALFGALLFLFAHRAETIQKLVDVKTRELAESETRHREALEAAQAAILGQLAEGVIVADASGRITLVNEAAAIIHGVECLDVEPNAYSDTYHLFTEDGQPYPALDLPLTRAVRGETVTDTRWRVRRPDGAEVLAIGSARPLHGRDGRQSGAVLTLRDDTAREAAERSLREGEARLRALTDNMPSGMVYQIATDRDGSGRRFLYVSRSHERLTGVPAEAVLADPTIPYNLILPEHRAALAAAETAALHDRAPLDVEARFRRADTGEVRWSRIISAPRPLPNGSLVWDGLQIDITDQKRAEEALRELNATLSERVAERTREAESARADAERSSAAKTDFLASMSHEIRTPLNGILGYTDLLLDESAIGPTVRKHGERIRNAGSALLTVVNDILDFSKIEAGQIDLDPRPFPLAALIDNSVSIVSGLALGKGIALSSRLDPSLPPLLIGDADRLRQVLLNLLNNAVKFTSKGRVEVVAEKVQDTGAGVRLRIAVTDTGIGIPLDRLGCLFERFSQVDGSISRRFGGTGLGLAISKRLVELMDGCIDVTSQEGQGSTFSVWLTLPVADIATGQDIVPAVPADASVGGASGGRSAWILLAEDLDINQDLARAVLERAGHRVDVVSDGAQALQAVQREVYDLVLMDVQMPVMDGVEAARRIRGLAGPARRVPVVALTANVLPDQIARFRAAGMDDHVGKPFRRDELIAAVERWAGGEDKTPPCRHDAVGPAVFDEVVAMLGRERARGLLDCLAAELGARFVRAEPTLDRERLARDAHAMVSAGGALGFVRLAALCHEVEAACATGDDYEEPLARLRQLARETVEQIGALRVA